MLALLVCMAIIGCAIKGDPMCVLLVILFVLFMGKEILGDSPDTGKHKTIRQIKYPVNYDNKSK